MAMKKRRRDTRQEWKPNLFLRILGVLASAACSAVKVVLGAAATVVLIVLVCGFVLVGAMGDYLQNDVVPNANVDFDQYKLDKTSFIYYVDKEGQIQKLQQIYTETNRQMATYDEIPEDLVHAAIAIEDKRFYEHQGVDWITTVKACANMFFGGSSTFGGSTITQQLIKNMTGKDSITVQRKVEEIFSAQKLEMRYSKERIMQEYLNTIYLGEGSYGVKSAARVYFGKELSDLTTAECASLISITNNPSIYDPYISEERNRERQLTVLEQMKEQEWITEEEYEEAVNQKMFFTSTSAEVANETYVCPNCGFEDIILNYNRVDDEFFCPECENKMDIELDASTDMYSWFTEAVLDDVAKALAEQMGLEWNYATEVMCMNNIKTGGYHIYATIDPEVQEIVDSVYTDLSQIPTTDSDQQLQSAIVIVDNRTGDIVAMAGAVGEKVDYDAFNFATDQGLQTGSSMKPVAVYGPAFEAGAISPATVLPDLPLKGTNGNFPLNDWRSYDMGSTLWEGVRSSTNTISINTLDLIGTRYSFDFAKEKFRLHGLLESEITPSGMELTDIGYAPLGLGALTYGVTIRDMSSAYAVFPSNGLWREGRTFTKVYDSDGNLVIDNEQESEQIMSFKAANYMNYCLRSCVSEGYAGYAELDNTAAGGKTGTTSDDKDRWFCGYTRYYSAACWTGFKYPESIHTTDDWRNPAGRLWAKVMNQVHQGLDWQDLYDSSGMQWVTVCMDSGGLATDACRADPRGNRTQSVLVYPEDMPTHSCTKHIMVPYCVAGGAPANEYCKKVPGNQIGQIGLLKLTQSEIDEIRMASDVNGFSDDLIYLVDESGNPQWFYGLGSNINKDVKSPCKLCTAHTKESIQPPKPKPEPKPEKPEKPEQPEKPEKPETPETPEP